MFEGATRRAPDEPPGHSAHGTTAGQTVSAVPRTAQVAISGEALRQLVETEGKHVVGAQKAGQLPINWSAATAPS